VITGEHRELEVPEAMYRTGGQRVHGEPHVDEHVARGHRRARRHVDRDLAIELGQRRQIEVVVVLV
jgi:hypothetical protein